MVFDRPVFEMPSCGTPQSGPMRGNSTNSSAITGAPSSAVRAASAAGLPAGSAGRPACARGRRAVSRPQTETSIASRDRQRLRIEEVGEDDEEAEEEDDEGVAARAQLERLQRHQRDRQRDAGLLAEQRAVRPAGQADRRARARRPSDPAARQRRRWRAPGARARRSTSAVSAIAPGRQVRGMRQHRPGDHGEQEQRVARLARQALPAGPARHGRRRCGRERCSTCGGLSCHSASASRQRAALRVAVGRRDLEAGQAQAVVGAGAVARPASRRPGATGAPRARARAHAAQSSQSSWRAEALVSRLTSSAPVSSACAAFFQATSFSGSPRR